MDAGAVSIILSILTILSGIVMFRLQMHKERRKDESDVLLKTSDAGLKQSEAWEKLVEDLRDELDRQKKAREEKERELLVRLNSLQDEFNTNAQYFQERLEDQRKLHLSIVSDLRAELDKSEARIKELVEQNRALTALVNWQAEKLQLLQEENETFKKELRQLKKDTGELNNGEKG